MISMVRGDTYPPAGVTIKTSAGVALDLTGATAKFYLYDKNTDAVIVNGATATVDVPAAGHVKYDWTAGDTSGVAAGEYYGRFRVTLASGKILSAPANNTYTFRLF